MTIAVSKKPGENAIDVAAQVLRARASCCEGSYVPEGVEITVTRNYGVTANDKAKKLIQKLMFATPSVVLLVVLAMGRREAVVVGAAVVVTLAATLFASWAWGFTINRVSLFALIFSIGILVDDAIVIVENIHRRMALGGGHARRADSARGRRGRRPDDPRHLHGDRGAAADGVRQRPDGPLHEPDPDQLEPRHADLAGRRAGVHALAVAQAASAAHDATPWRLRRRRRAIAPQLFERVVRPFLDASRRTRAVGTGCTGASSPRSSRR